MIITDNSGKEFDIHFHDPDFAELNLGEIAIGIEYQSSFGPRVWAKSPNGWEAFPSQYKGNLCALKDRFHEIGEARTREDAIEIMSCKSWDDYRKNGGRHAKSR